MLISLMIFAGTVLMAYNIFAFIRFSRQISEKGNWNKEKQILQMPIILLVMFFFGYIMIGLFGDPDFIVAAVLLGGSIFVFLMDTLVVQISEKICENERLESDLIAAESASKAKTFFLSNMSHDIRTPLNAIMGFTQLASEDGLSEEERLVYLDKISASSFQLLSIIDDVLEMSRIESGKLELKEEKTDLKRLINDIGDLIENQMRDKGIEFVRNINIADGRVLCDRTQLSRAVMNLLSNAWKFTPEKGKVDFSIRQIVSDEDTDIYEFRVKDTGIGMSEEFQNHIFKPFERERTSSVSKIQGTGLGMSITKNIVEMMNGTVEVFSKQGQGSEFLIRIPLKKDSEGSQQRIKSSGTRESFDSVKVLLTEDNPINMEIATAILKKYGFEVDTAVNGSEAFEKAKQDHYDLILMDIQMPVMDGYEACRCIREAGIDVPVIALTANAFKEDQEKAKEAGMNGHIEKPINTEVMLSTISQVLDEGGSQ